VTGKFTGFAHVLLGSESNPCYFIDMFLRCFARRTLFIAVGAALASLAPAVTLYTVREADDTLVKIDSVTHVETVVGALGVSFNFGDLAYDTANSTLYMVDGRANASLYKVNVSTGAATLIGVHGVVDMFGLAYDASTDTLFSSQFSQGTGVWKLDKVTGAATFLGDSQVGGLGGMVVNTATNQLVGINDGSGNLFSVNRLTGASTLIASPGNNNDSGLTYDSATGLFWNIDWSGNLYSINPGAGYARTTVATGLNPHDGLAIIPVPEPASLTAVGLGLLAAIRRRQKKS
jgi:hypothetical protein